MTLPLLCPAGMKGMEREQNPMSGTDAVFKERVKLLLGFIQERFNW